MIMDFESVVLNINQETADVKTFHFSVPNSFTFLPGQYVMLELEINGNNERRAFSISSSPTRKGFIEITKRIVDTEFSKRLASLKKGNRVKIKGPYGVFVFDESSNAVLLAGGIGITPFRCFVEYATDKHLKNKIVLFYSNKTPEEIAFRKELNELTKKNKNLKIIETITRPEESHEEWNDSIGRIDENMIREHAEIDGSIFYICGPPTMVDTMVEIVKNMNIPKEKIRTERFTGYK